VFNLASYHFSYALLSITLSLQFNKKFNHEGNKLKSSMKIYSHDCRQCVTNKILA